MNKKALIIVDHGSTVDEANDMLADIAGLVAAHSTRSGFSIVHHCHMEIAEPTISQAFDRCVAEGAGHIVVLPFFLAPGKHSTQDIPNMVEDAASKHNGVSYVVAEPLGIDHKIIELILERANSANHT